MTGREMTLDCVAFEEQLRKWLMNNLDPQTEHEHAGHEAAVAWYRSCAPIKVGALPHRPIYQFYRRRDGRRFWYDLEPSSPADTQFGSRLIGVFPILEIPDPDGAKMDGLLTSGVDPFTWLKQELMNHAILSKVVRPIVDETLGMFLFLDLRRPAAAKKQDQLELMMKLAFG